MHSLVLPKIGLGLELLPPLTLLVRPTHDRARLKVALLCLLLFMFEQVSQIPGLNAQGHNLWLSYIIYPVQTVIVTALLSEWQRGPQPRRILVALGVIVAVIVTVLGLTIENRDTNGLVAGVLSACFLLAASLYTLVVRSLDERQELRRADWFWVCAGLALYFIPDTGYDPVQRWLISVHDETTWFQVLYAKALAQSLAMLLLAWGLLRPVSRPAATS